jgi:hypothetical protein
MAQARTASGDLITVPDDATPDQVEEQVRSFEAQQAAQQQPAATGPTAPAATPAPSAAPPAPSAWPWSGEEGLSGLTGHLLNAATLGWGNKASALIEAGINAADRNFRASAGMQPYEDDPGSFGADYQQRLTDYDRVNRTYALEHPGWTTTSELVGAVAPGSLGARAVSAVGRVAPALVSGGGLVRTGVTGAGIGAVGGAVEAAGQSQAPSLGGEGSETMGQAASDIGKNAAFGAGGGAVLGPVGNIVGSAVISPLARMVGGAVQRQGENIFGSEPMRIMVGGGPVERQAGNLLGTTYRGGVGAGEDVAAMGSRLGQAQATGTPLTPAEVATPGGPLSQLAATIAREPGPVRTQIVNTDLAARDAAAGQRLKNVAGNAIDTTGEIAGVTPENQPSLPGSAAARLEAERAAAAKADYGAAGANTDSPQRLITDPAVNDMVASTPALQREIIDARNTIPGYANLPDNDMRLLHAAFEGTGQRANSALTPDNRYAYGQLNRQFGKALGQANPDYAAAVANYSANSEKIRALEDGTGFLGPNAPGSSQVLAGYAGKPNADELAQLYRTGALDAINSTIDRAGLGSDEARRLFSSPDRIAQLRPVFGAAGDPAAADAGFARFRQQGQDESAMFDAYRAVRQGQFQAPPAAPEQPGVWPRLVSTGVGFLAHPILGAERAGNLISYLSSPHATASPAVREAAGRMLWSQEPAVQQQALRAMAAPPPAPAGSRLAATLGAPVGAYGSVPAYMWWEHLAGEPERR